MIDRDIAAGTGAPPTIDASKLAQLQQTAAFVSQRVTKVALLYGGTSGEREVSLASGASVCEVLQAEGFDVTAIDTAAPHFADSLLASRPDVAFIALHGQGGEDGCIQGFLETLHIPYTHSGVAASALAMDKRVSKLLYQAAGLYTAAFTTANKGAFLAVLDAEAGATADAEGSATAGVSAGAEGNAGATTTTTAPTTTTTTPADIDALLATVGLPCVVKPVCDGSSLGVSIPKTRAEFLTALATGFAVADDLLIEEFIGGTEVTVPVLGNSSGTDNSDNADGCDAGSAPAPPAAVTPSAPSDRTPSAELLALPVIEIVPKNEFYDYESKYAEGGSVHIIPARVSERETALCQRVAIEAHRALGCSGVSRTDIIVTPRGEACVIETNTIPGMTGTSLIPEDARKVGLTPGQLYRLLMHYALQRTASS